MFLIWTERLFDMRVKLWLGNLALTVASVLGTLLVFELVLRFLPVTSSLYTQPVNSERPVLHFAPNQTFVWSQGWSLRFVNRGHINNAGYVNDEDYETADARPLLAVIGDSYVEALMVHFAESVAGRLAAPGRRVFSFGASGAPLSQYLIWAQEAVAKYGARYLVINIVGNDFDESLLQYNSDFGFHYYAEDEAGRLRLTRVDYNPSILRRMASHSALARYLAFNLNVRSLLQLLTARPHPVAYGNTIADETRLRDSMRAVDAFLQDVTLMTNLPSTRILLVMDGLRYPGISANAQNSYFVKMRKYLIQASRSRGFESIDMDDWFFWDYSVNGRLFHIDGDGHWNSYGHGIVASAIRDSRLYSSFVQGN